RIALSDLMALSRLSAKLLGSLGQQRRHICARPLALSASSDWPHHDRISHPSMEATIPRYYWQCRAPCDRGHRFIHFSAHFRTIQKYERLVISTARIWQCSFRSPSEHANCGVLSHANYGVVNGCLSYWLSLSRMSTARKPLVHNSSKRLRLTKVSFDLHVSCVKSWANWPSPDRRQQSHDQPTSGRLIGLSLARDLLTLRGMDEVEFAMSPNDFAMSPNDTVIAPMNLKSSAQTIARSNRRVGLQVD